MYNKEISEAIGVADKAIADKDQDSINSLDLIKSEINSDSKFVKNARPTIIYVGLLVILLDALGIRLGMLNLFDVSDAVQESSNQIVDFFLVSWGGVAAWYSKGRTTEKINSKRILAEIIDKQESRKEERRESKHTRREERRDNKFNRRRR